MAAIAAAIADLKSTFSTRDIVSTDEADLIHYSKALYPQYPSRPHPELRCVLVPLDPTNSRLGSPHAIVVHVSSTEDVVKTVNISRKHSVPIVVRGGGTGLEGSQSVVSPSLTQQAHEFDRI